MPPPGFNHEDLGIDTDLLSHSPRRLTLQQATIYQDQLSRIKLIFSIKNRFQPPNSIRQAYAKQNSPIQIKIPSLYHIHDSSKKEKNEKNQKRCNLNINAKTKTTYHEYPKTSPH